jgi:hypothetical protein
MNYFGDMNKLHTKIRIILGSHGGEYEGDRLLRYSAM